MQNVTSWIGHRWRSGCVGKLTVIIGGMVLGCCLCSVPVAIFNPPTPTPSTRSRPVVDVAPTATATILPTDTATPVPPTATPQPTSTDTPIPPTDTPLPPPTIAPTVARPTSTPAPVVAPPVRAVPAVPLFTCAGGCTEPPDPSCNIKGNISISSGEKIYHVPGQRNYDDTEISPEFGERWFCTEEEAVAAGWRKAMR